MAKMTAEEKKEKMDIKKAAAKAKKAAKRAALLEKKRKQAEAKKAAREAKKAKRLARLEKEKAKKAALKEKKRLAKEKKAAKTMKIAAKKIDTLADVIDIKEASKTIKLAMAQIASQMAEFDDDKRAKKAKSISWMGYDVETKDGNVIVRFAIEKSKKVKTATIESVTKEERKPREKNVTENTDEQKPEVNKVVVDEMETTPAYPDNKEKLENMEVPAGDIYGQNGTPTGEVANVESDDEDLVTDENEDGEENEDEDNFSTDSRDEQDEDLVDSRREFFSQFGDDFEPNDD